ncbi:MAG: hypothetical protein FJ280_29595, partial [Planctomycetes bacterium]|nr:hypothetical protein [Planctomycetota bacterium]
MAIDPVSMNVLINFAIFSASIVLGILLRAKRRRQEAHEPYGWEPRTTQREGVPIEIIVGTVPVQGNAFCPWTQPQNTEVNENVTPLQNRWGLTVPYLTTLRLLWNLQNPPVTIQVVVASRHVLNARLAFADGPVHGLRVEYSRLQGRPLASWSGVTATERRGTDNQTATGLGDRVESALEIVVESGAPETVLMTARDLDDAAIVVGSLDGLVRHGDSTGNRLVERLGCKIEIRHVGGAWHTLFDYTLMAKTANPVRWLFEASGTYQGG